MPEITGQDEARRALTVDQQKLLDALTYFRPHWAANGPVMLTSDKMREHLAVIESTLRHFAEAALRAPSLDRGAEEMKQAAVKVCEAVADSRLGKVHPMSAAAATFCAHSIRALPVPADLNEGGGK